MESNRHAFKEFEAIRTLKCGHLAEFANTQMVGGPGHLANVEVETIMFGDGLDGYSLTLIALKGNGLSVRCNTLQ
jgi:hypothetical protein